MTTWTDERTDLLKSLLSDCRSAREIAAQLGGVTRNAVIGKVVRLGLTLPNGGTARAAYSPEHAREMAHQRASRARAGRTCNTQRLEALLRRSEVAVDLPHDDAPSAPVTLMELRDHHCRWPHEQPGQSMMYCGALAIERLPYCAPHCRIAYRLPERRAA